MSHHPYCPKCNRPMTKTGPDSWACVIHPTATRPGKPKPKNGRRKKKREPVEEE